jgi:hypothetical protein
VLVEVVSLVDYILVYRPYNAKKLIDDAMKGGARGEDEAKDFMYALRDRVSKGFTVKNSGCFTVGESVVFWALWKRSKKEPCARSESAGRKERFLYYG